MTELELWAASGAMALTGRAGGPPMAGPGRPASWLADRLADLAALSPGIRFPGVGLLGQRAAHAGFTRRGPWSCGGAFRVLHTRDGAVGLSLSRPADVDLLPALVGGPVDAPWPAVATWAAARTADDAAARIRELGLPGGTVGAVDRARPPVLRTSLGRRRGAGSPLVVDLSALWAGPLCTSLLALAGARVVAVETPARPDGTRAGSPTFHRALRRRAEQRVLPLNSPQLRSLLARADVVVESARPRAMQQAGVVAEDVVSRGATWVSITAAGRDSADVGFGDDVAARAGHVVEDGADLLPVGDALADPLTGVEAAVAALDCWTRGSADLVDVSMLHVAAEALGPPPADGGPRRPPPHVVEQDRDGRWWVTTADGRSPVADPHGAP